MFSEMAISQAEKQELRPPRADLVRTIREYAHSKGKNEEPILERASEFALEGSAQLDRDAAVYIDRSQDQPLNIEQSASEISEKMLAPIREKLQGQELKFQRAEFFVSTMIESSMLMVSEKIRAAREKGQEVDQQQLLQETLIMVQTAADKITFQDSRASALTLGDHGWMHLIQDYRDASLIAEGFKGGKLDGTEQFILGMTAAYHDIGYANPLVHEQQRARVENYSFDKGHPTTSAIYVELHKQDFLKVMSEEEYQAFLMAVINHENPSKAEDAGSKYEHLSRAFAFADSGAAFGVDKLPPVIAQFPESVEYLSLLSKLDWLTKTRKETEGSLEKATQANEEPELIAQLTQYVGGLSAQEQSMKEAAAESRTRLEAQIAQQAPQQAVELVHALDHFSPKSLSFLVGRLSGEMAPIQVMEGENGQKKLSLTINAGVTQDYKKSEYFGDASLYEAGVNLATKLFVELSGLPSNTDQSIIAAAFKPENTQGRQNLATTLTITESQGNVTLTTLDSRIEVVYRGQTAPEAQKPYYDRILKSLNAAQETHKAISR